MCTLYKPTRSSNEKLNILSMCLAQAAHPYCGFLVTLYDLIWPEGGLCEPKGERSPVRFYFVGVEASFGSCCCPSINWLMRNSFMWKTKWITLNSYILACRTLTWKHTEASKYTLWKWMGGWLAVLTNRWWIGPSYPHTHALTQVVECAPMLRGFVSKLRHKTELADWELYGSNPPVCCFV